MMIVDAQVVTEAPAVRRLRGFVEWVGGGQPLTQTGRIRRVDALALVARLDTGDVLDPRLPIQSSSELPGLSVVFEWAKRCGVARVLRGRIVPVSRHARLLDDPFALLARMLESLPSLCQELGHSVVMADAERTTEALLCELVGHGALSVERGCELAWRSATSRYWFPHATDQQIDWQRRRSDGDVRWLLATLAELGFLEGDGGSLALTSWGGRLLRPHLGLGTPKADNLTVTVTLRESTAPVVWRRLCLPADMRLDRVHDVVQAAMGWQDCHLHVFEREDARYGYADPELDIQDERTMTLGQLLSRAGDRLEYTYDFGDGWSHEILLEAIGDPDDRARCVDGAGRCPPEDVGGTFGFDDLKQILADPEHDEHEAMLDWLAIASACDFDAERFELAQADAAVACVPADRFC